MLKNFQNLHKECTCRRARIPPASPPMKTQGLLGIVLLFVFAVSAIAGEELSLRPEATSSSIRMDTVPLAPSAPVQVVYDLQSLGGAAQVRPELGISPVFTER